MTLGFSYRQIPDSEERIDEERQEKIQTSSNRESRWPIASKSVALVTVIALATALIAVSGYLIFVWGIGVRETQGLCSNPVVRKEWRTASENERRQYLSAIDCLYKMPSKIRPSMTIYEDFSWTHNLQSNLTHHTASFLPWHRYFLQVHLTALRTHCGFNGDLLYWDWTQDYENPSSSAIFDPDHGFGGDGTPDEPLSVSNGTCLPNGRFADYYVLYVNSDYAPHCLSRKFGETFFGLDVSQSPYRPETIQDLLASSSYEEFDNRVRQLHDDLHDGIGGDLQFNTSPYDPVFFVHHVQWDRLWWLWQLKDPRYRLSDYAGDNGEHALARNASLSDPLLMEPLAGSLMVSSVMSTETDLLCYRY